MAAITMALEWNIWYPEWMIGDGLPNRSVGEEFSWEVEFHPSQQLTKAVEQRKTAVPIPEYRYCVMAELVCLSEQACVIDFGLKVVGEADSIASECRPGDYVTGEVVLSLTHGCVVPAEKTLEFVSRKWRVNAIQADITPHISLPDNPQFFFRDESRIKYQSVWSTGDIRTHAYVLHCSETL
jgi:hypothetical protein